MKVSVVVVGRVRGELDRAVSEYERRAARYWKLEVVEVPAGASGRGDPGSVMAAEEERVLSRVPAGAELVALTRAGETMDSPGLARYLGELALRSAPGVVFAIGGAYGLGSRVLSRAGRLLSVSPFTLPHELARLVLAEQLYRAGTILRGEPYHKGGGVS